MLALETKSGDRDGLGPRLQGEPSSSSAEGGRGGKAAGPGREQPRGVCAAEAQPREDRWLVLLFNSSSRLYGRPVGERVRGEKAGSAGTNRLRSGPDACRTMGLLKEMREEAWRSLCTASALQVGMGQLRFNEVHS